MEWFAGYLNYSWPLPLFKDTTGIPLATDFIDTIITQSKLGKICRSHAADSLQFILNYFFPYCANQMEVFLERRAGGRSYTPSTK